ncbi:MAG TPA: acyl-CoA dehydrogenase family protein [Pirellulales bacterium]|nr:acyl-CoA dehydrogenase family protein [Pirellulales bacterium]
MSQTRSSESDAETFVEASLKLSGKSAEEARSTGAIDRADEHVESFFEARYQTTASPIHRAVWDHNFPLELFQPTAPPRPTPACQKTMEESLSIVRRHIAAGSLLDERGKLWPHVFAELGAAGYWGMLVEREYGGHQTPMSIFMPFLTKMATVFPTLAGLGSVHGCVGAVDPLHGMGTPEQKQRFLTRLASGERISGFALTEPGAGSDMTALKTRAVLDGDDYVVNGEKLFITNAFPGRIVALVCLIDNRPEVLLVDLPEENENFQLVRYGLYALKHSFNNGLKFKDFRVPKENLLRPKFGNGLTVAYHGLNRGRVAVCANASGGLRTMLASILPWARYRYTYGEPIERRELVQRRVGRLAGMIVACDALVAWCSWLLDEGYRGEMECTIAKIFGSEAQKEAAVEFLMKTHGGRSFLHGHLFGDEVHEYFAPCIYEGEGEMLAMAFFKSLVKEHGKAFFEPVGRVLAELQVKEPNLASLAHLKKLAPVLVPYAKWMAGERFGSRKVAPLPTMPEVLAAHARFAIDGLQHMAREISAAMRKHQLQLADRQCRMSQLSLRVQNFVTMLVTAIYAGRQQDPLLQAAGDVACQDLRQKLTLERPSDAYFRTVTKLGAKIADGGFEPMAGIPPGEILKPYEHAANK